MTTDVFRPLNLARVGLALFMTLHVTHEAYAQGTNPKPPLLSESDLKPCEELLTKSMTLNVQRLKRQIQDHGPSGQARIKIGDAISNSRVARFQQELDQISGRTIVEIYRQWPPFDPPLNLQRTREEIKRQTESVAALKSGSDEGMIRVYGVTYSGKDLEDRLISESSYLCVLNVRIAQIAGKGGAAAPVAQAPAQMRSPPVSGVEMPWDRNNTCTEEIKRTQIDSQTWTGNPDDVAARLGRFQKDLFEGRCSSHPEARAYSVGAMKMLAYGGNPAGSSGGAQPAVAASTAVNEGGSSKPPPPLRPDINSKEHNPGISAHADLRDCEALTREVSGAIDGKELDRGMNLLEQFEASCSQQSQRYADLAGEYKRRIAEASLAQQTVALPRRGANAGSALFQSAISRAEQEERDRPARLARAAAEQERLAREQAAAAAREEAQRKQAAAAAREEAQRSESNTRAILGAITQVLGAAAQIQQDKADRLQAQNEEKQRRLQEQQEQQRRAQEQQRRISQDQQNRANAAEAARAEALNREAARTAALNREAPATQPPVRQAASPVVENNAVGREIRNSLGSNQAQRSSGPPAMRHLETSCPPGAPRGFSCGGAESGGTDREKLRQQHNEDQRQAAKSRQDTLDKMRLAQAERQRQQDAESARVAQQAKNRAREQDDRRARNAALIRAQPTRVNVIGGKVCPPIAVFQNNTPLVVRAMYRFTLIRNETQVLPSQIGWLQLGPHERREMMVIGSGCETEGSTWNIAPGDSVLTEDDPNNYPQS